MSSETIPAAGEATGSRPLPEGAGGLDLGTSPYPLAKRVFDFSIATLLLVLLSPFMLLVALLVRASSLGPVLFRQTRVGRGERSFEMLKFRTMRVNQDDAAHRSFNQQELLGDIDSVTADGVFKPENDSRITPLGQVLRRYSIDELPQLINVVRGEMSLVGPRPALSWEVALFSPAQRRRHTCPPGMTGLWQVSGRSRLSMPEMLELDLVYRRQASLGTDVRILLRTPRAVFLERATR